MAIWEVTKAVSKRVFKAAWPTRYWCIRSYLDNMKASPTIESALRQSRTPKWTDERNKQSWCESTTIYDSGNASGPRQGTRVVWCWLWTEHWGNLKQTRITGQNTAPDSKILARLARGTIGESGRRKADTESRSPHPMRWEQECHRGVPQSLRLFGISHLCLEL